MIFFLENKNFSNKTTPSTKLFNYDNLEMENNLLKEKLKNLELQIQISEYQKNTNNNNNPKEKILFFLQKKEEEYYYKEKEWISEKNKLIEIIQIQQQNHLKAFPPKETLEENIEFKRKNLSYKKLKNDNLKDSTFVKGNSFY